MRFETSPSQASLLEKALDSVGIEFNSSYVQSSVPCQSVVIIDALPKSQLEIYAVMGIFR